MTYVLNIGASASSIFKETRAYRTHRLKNGSIREEELSPVMPKVRVRNRHGKLQIRPTRRKQENNLTDGSTIRDVSVKLRPDGSPKQVRLNLKGIEIAGEPGMTFQLVPEKHNWYTLEKAGAGVSRREMIASIGAY